MMAPVILYVRWSLYVLAYKYQIFYTLSLFPGLYLHIVLNEGKMVQCCHFERCLSSVRLDSLSFSSYYDSLRNLGTKDFCRSIFFTLFLMVEINLAVAASYSTRLTNNRWI
jgi:hypothetical protein